MVLHFYGLFYDKIINDKLANEWEYQDNIPIYVGKNEEYTLDEVKEEVQEYITEDQLEKCLESINKYKQIHIDFIKYLSILNQSLNKDEVFEYNILNFNGQDPINNIEYRRLLGINKDGEFEDGLPKYLMSIAKSFADLSLEISYARENIKALVQQYAYIGTNKIITDVVRDYFLKNFSKRSDWRLSSDKIFDFEEGDASDAFLSLDTLNGKVTETNPKSQFFDVNVVEYYDNTQYLNIYAELPSTIVGYEVSGQTEAQSSYLITADIISAWKIDETYPDLTTGLVSGQIVSGVLSTMYDTLDFEIPSSLWPQQTQTLGIDPTWAAAFPEAAEVLSTTEIWNKNAPTSIFIPIGTEVSSTIPAGTSVTSTYYVDNLVPITGLCANYVTDYNTQFWVRDFSKESPSSVSIKNEISFYEQFFDNLKNAKSDEEKFQVYTEEVYPLLSSTWETFATSGFLSNPLLSAMQFRYNEKYSTANIGNDTFTTIAPIPYVRNLMAIQDGWSETALYLAKPFYENIAYYIALMTKEILNMQEYNAKNGLAVPKEGWRQSSIEYRGYNSYYENAKNLTDISVVPSAIIDCDGPWVYSSLQQFIKLYLDNNNQIPFEQIKNYVDKFYVTCTQSVKDNIYYQLYIFQHDIIDKQNYSISEFQQDQWDNQFALYKHNDYAKYEDAGEIWVRIKNYPLSVPLMNYNIIFDYADGYYNDKFDTLQCNQQYHYANMLKELTNNAIRFGIIGSTMWILGYSSYVYINNMLEKDTNAAYLKLCCFKYDQNIDLNTLTVDIPTIKFHAFDERHDSLNSIDEFIGAYFNQYNDSIEFVLYNKQKHMKTTDIPSTLMTEIPLLVHEYQFKNLANNFRELDIQGIFPAINLASTEITNDFQTWKDRHNELPISSKILGKSVYTETETKDFYGIVSINDNNQYIIDNGTVSSSTKMISASGLVTNQNNNILDITYSWIDENLPLTANIVSTAVTGEVLFNKLYFGNDTGLTTKYENIWRLNSDYVNVNIAYEALNPAVTGIVSSLIKGETLNSKYIGVVRFTCPLIINSINANDNLLYLTNISGLTCEWTAAEVFLSNSPNEIEYRAIHNKYPDCSINAKNELVVDMIVTQLGGHKTYELENTIDHRLVLPSGAEELLANAICDTQSGAIQKLQEQIVETPKLSSGFNELTGMLNDDGLGNWKNGWTQSYYDYYQDYLNGNLDILPKYNAEFDKLTTNIDFIPGINTCLVEPLKLIFNFGSLSNKDLEKYNDIFDLDIKVALEDGIENNKAVGWKCRIY